jgi:P2-related tail formation protein
MAIFDDLWSMYPKKVGKGTARKALSKAMAKAPIDQIQLSLALFVRAWGSQDKKFMPHLATWLNGERWDDELQQQSLQDMTSDQQMQAILFSSSTDRKMIQ